MARLQDFQQVTPTDSDNLLVVQATGQGLASVGSTLGSKMDKANPTGTGSLSLNRKANTTIGTNSVTFGNNCEATANYSLAEGDSNKASGAGSHAEGYQTIASGNMAHAEGYGTHSVRRSQHVFGEFNTEDTGGSGTTGRGNYIEVVGKGTSDSSRSNARTLDWSGNEVLAGDLTIMGSKSLNAAMVGEDISSHFHAGTGHTITSAKKFGNLIVLTITTSKVTSANSSIQVGTIDSGYRPTAPASGTLLNATASDFGYGTIGITTAGVINLVYSRTTSYGLYTTIVYSI